MPLPVLTPRLSSYWINLVTTVPASLARPLALGLSNEVVVRDDRISRLIPPEWVYCDDASYAGGTVLESAYRLRLRGRPEEVWPGLASLGGQTGWYAYNWLWRLRGLCDKLISGVGLDRSRRHPRQVGAGDALDFWRVLEAEEPRRLLLLAEMKAPG